MTVARGADASRTARAGAPRGRAARRSGSTPLAQRRVACSPFRARASAGEQALRAARCALALARVAAGGAARSWRRGACWSTGEQRVGEVIDRAAAALVAAREPGERRRPGRRRDRRAARGALPLREATASGAAPRRRGGASRPVRTLLGKPTPCVGREAQLAHAQRGARARARTSRARRGARHRARPGSARRTLVRELLATSQRGETGERRRPLRERRSDPRGVAVRDRRADPRARGRSSATPTDRTRAEKLAALVARDFARERRARACASCSASCAASLTPHADASAALRAARADLSIMADALRDAWIDVARARAPRGRTVLVAARGRALGRRRVAAPHRRRVRRARRPAALRARDGAPRRRARRSPDRFRRARPRRADARAALAAPRRSGSCAARSGAAADAELVDALVRRSGGHPFHLEELVRAVADGRGAGCAARLGARHGAGAPRRSRRRRAARAARGERLRRDVPRRRRRGAAWATTCPSARSRAVLGAARRRRSSPRSARRRGAARPSYRFRHALVRDAAYATLTDADLHRARTGARARGSRRSARPIPRCSAEHYDRGATCRSAPPRSSARAAAQALQRNDFERAHAHAERALALGPDRRDRGGVCAHRGRDPLLARRFRRPPRSARRARCSRLPRGGAGVVRRGRPSRSARSGSSVATTRSPTLLRDAAQRRVAARRAAAPHVVALCRGMTQLFWAHSRRAAWPTCARASTRSSIAPEPLDAYQAGWVHRVRGESAWLHERNVGRASRSSTRAATPSSGARARAALPVAPERREPLGWSGDRRAGSSSSRRRAPMPSGSARDSSELRARGRGSSSRVRRRCFRATMRRVHRRVAGSPRLAFIRFVLAASALDARRSRRRATGSRAARGLGAVVEANLRAAGLALASRDRRARAVEARRGAGARRCLRSQNRRRMRATSSSPSAWAASRSPKRAPHEAIAAARATCSLASRARSPPSPRQSQPTSSARASSRGRFERRNRRSARDNLTFTRGRCQGSKRRGASGAGARCEMPARRSNSTTSCAQKFRRRRRARVATEPKSPLVEKPHVSVLLHQRLVEAEPGRAARARDDPLEHGGEVGVRPRRSSQPQSRRTATPA